MSDFTPGLPTKKTLVFVDNNGNRFSTDIEVNPGAPGAGGTGGGISPNGGTISGNLVLDAGNDATPWSVTPQNILRVGDHEAHISGQMTGEGDLQVLLGVDNYAPWVFRPGKHLIFTPTGNTVVEANDSATAPVLIQRFNVTAKNGDYVAFPKAFSSDTVRVIVPSYFDGTSFVLGGTDRQKPTDRNGFTLSKWSAGPNPGWNNYADTMDIIAIGAG